MRRRCTSGVGPAVPTGKLGLSPDQERKGKPVRLTVRVAALLSAGLAVGCSYIQVPLKYEQIIRGAEDPTAIVALQVVDKRDPDHGGSDSTEVGRMRVDYGIPVPVHATDPKAVAHLVRDATIDALRQARVTVVNNNNVPTLLASVTTFWADGFIGYKATVDVFCELRDQRGALLWSSTISGVGGATTFSSPWRQAGFFQPAFQEALVEYAEHALVQFNAPAFQKYLF
jgi:hypothetical protein